MRRLVILLLALTLLFGAQPADAQGTLKTYRSDVMGVTFQYPADWTIREQMPTQTVLAAAESDLQAVADGKQPEGLLFSVTISSLRQMGAQSIDDFGGLLKRITGLNDLAPTPVKIGGADGLVATTTSSEQDLGTRTAILSTGRRRVAIVRGVATLTGWVTGGDKLFESLVSGMSFFLPPGGGDLDNIGSVLWQLSADKMPNLTDLAVSTDGATVYAAERTQGIWTISANGIGGAVQKPTEIGEFAGVTVLMDGSAYVADPGNHALWLITPGDGKVTRLVGGEIGTGRGAFGPTSPRFFAFAPRYIYVLDENESGLRIQLLNRGGSPVTFWNFSNALSIKIDAPLMAADGDGNAYILGKNSDGIIKIDASGKVVNQNIGKGALANSEPLALAVDRFDNFYIATSDQGILHLDMDGNLLSVIGVPYDESAPPKPGQLARPVALALAPNGGPMYVADASARYPQIVAFALDGNTAVNLQAGTRDMGQIAYGQTVSGSIGAQAFMLTYAFQGKAGDTITITMQASEGSALDSAVEVLGPDGKPVAFNDDAKAPGLGAKDAQIKALKLPGDGAYTIRATRFGREAARGEGAFSLMLEVTP